MNYCPAAPLRAFQSLSSRSGHPVAPQSGWLLMRNPPAQTHSFRVEKSETSITAEVIRSSNDGVSILSFSAVSGGNVRPRSQGR